MTEENSSPAAKQGKTPRWVKWVLGLSLGFNIIVVGVVGGIALKHDRGGHHRGLAHHMVKFIEDDGRKDVAKQYLEASKEARNAARSARKEARLALAGLIEAKPFNRDEVDAALAVVANTEADMRNIRHANYSVILATMNEDERAKVAKALRYWSARRHGGRRWKRD